MMAPRSVHMPMLDLLLGGIAYIDDLNIEIQLHTGQRMVTVHSDRVCIQPDNRKENRYTCTIEPPLPIPYDSRELKSTSSLKECPARSR